MHNALIALCAAMPHEPKCVSGHLCKVHQYLPAKLISAGQHPVVIADHGTRQGLRCTASTDFDRCRSVFKHALCRWLCGRTDDQLFATARKIITAMIARIHTVEWTTAIVQHPAGRAGQVGPSADMCAVHGMMRIHQQLLGSECCAPHSTASHCSLTARV